MQQSTLLPIRIQEVFKLTNLNLNPDLFKFGNLTIESEKYICVKDGSDCVIIDTTKGFQADRKPMKADGIMMHRQKNIIALRAAAGETNTVIQIFDLDSKAKVRQADIPEQIVYWKWISLNKIGVVGKTAIYHLDITNNDPPVRVFERAAQLSTCQIMSYGVDPSEKWCYLVGLYSNEQKQIACHMQLFMIEKRQQQLLEGFAGCFADLPITDNVAYKNNMFCFCEKKSGESVQRVHFMEIGNPAPGQQKFKRSVEMQMPPDVQNDFPVLMQTVDRYGVVFILTKMGFLYMYEISNSVLLFRTRATDSLSFVSTKNPNTDGMISINKAGQVLSINIDENNFIPYIMNVAKHIQDNVGIAFKLAQRFSLKGADELFVTQFQKLILSGDFVNAARVARDAPGTLLRNQDTINKFKSLQSQGGPQPILVYFSTLLETTKLNEIESLELAKPVLAQGKMNLIEDWIKQDKLSFTDQLGDLIRQYNPQMAISIYMRSGGSEAPDKVIQSLIETNQFDKIMAFCTSTNYSPDFVKILRNIVQVNPEAAVGLAKMITNRDGGNVPKVSIDSVVQVFLENSRIQETTAFLLEALKQNRPDEGHLQTKLFEVNLMSAPNVAEGIFQLNLFTHYDRERVAKLCEQVGLYGRALQNYTSMQDTKRVMLNTHAIQKELLIEYFGRLSEDDALQCMYDLLKSNRQNVAIVAEIAVKYSSKINTKKSIEILESLGTNEGLLMYLANVLPHTEDQEIYFKYIQACARLGNYKEIERVIRETNYYDPIRVKDFLKEMKLPDPRPLIYLCDQHQFIEELTKYLHQNKQKKFIEIYLFKVNTAATPKVLGTLIDLDDETYAQQLLNSIRVCPIPELIDEFERRGKLKLLQGWLEARYEERIQEPALHNALAIIYVDINKDPQTFLINNTYYDSKVVGKYCEERNPDLAFIAYKRAWGSCDTELVEVTNKHYLYRMQARYLVERQSPELWTYVLREDNPHRKQVIDQVVQTALPETKNADEVSTTVKAFMDADMPNELIELLERIVLHNSDFANNKNLQNLLILTAIKADKTRVMDYINRLDNYDGIELAKIAKKDQYQLYDEALCIYRKFGEHVEAVRVLITNLQNIKGASEYAQKVNKPEVWTEIGKAQLDNFQIKEAIDAFIKAKDPSMYAMVIGTAENQDCYEDLVQFLLMARTTNLKEQMIDSELVFAYAKCGARYLPDLEAFIAESTQADPLKCGDRCFDEKLYDAALLLYKQAGNNPKLASTLVKLKQYQQAFEAAKKADSMKVWKEVCFACVRAKEFRTANLCGLKIIIQPDHLEDLIKHYERFGYHEDLIQLLEQGMSLERSHKGIYTELGVMYAKYSPQRLMDHIRTYCQKIQIQKLAKECERFQMWPEAVFLHSQDNHFDQAIITMMEHSPTAWKHDIFSQNIVKVSNHDLFYRAMIFYLEEEPMLLNDLLKLLGMSIDLNKCVSIMKRTGHIALIAPFLKSVQSQNISSVNEALNDIYLENEDYESLRASIKEYDSFESLKLASELENHSLLECRRIAALLYRKNKKFQQSIDISKKDELYKDAMESVAESRDPVLAEDLLRFIMNMEDKELFAAMLYTCYELVKPDVALEVAWRCGLYEYVMPYFIQFVKDLSSRVDVVQKKTDDIKKKGEKEAQDLINQPLDVGLDVGFLFPGMMGAGGLNQLQLMPPPGSMPNVGMGGMNYGGGGFGVGGVGGFNTGYGGYQ